MNNKLSIERIKQYATDPRMCNISDELRSGMVELLAYREAESKPVRFECRTKPVTFENCNWSPWSTCTEDSYNQIIKLDFVIHGMRYEVNKLYASPVLGQTPALTDVIAERQRQITTEGWTPEHDDQHSDNELAGAAACYAMNMHDFYIHYTDEFNWSEAPKPDDWPWSEKWWKPTSPRRDLVKAAALILAEIERLDRATIAKATGESE